MVAALAAGDIAADTSASGEGYITIDCPESIGPKKNLVRVQLHGRAGPLVEAPSSSVASGSIALRWSTRLGYRDQLPVSVIRK